MTRTPAAKSSQPARSRLAFHASRIIIDVGVLITLGAMSLRFVNGGATNIDSLSADALPALLLLVPVFAITLIPDHSRPLPAPLGWLALVLGIAAFPYAVIKHIDATTLAETTGGSVGLGARLLIVGTGVTLLGIAVGLARGLLRLPQGGAYPTQPPRRAQPPSPKRTAPENDDARETKAAKPERATRPSVPPERMPQARRPILPEMGRPEDDDGGNDRR
jgi:hypothetical protein